MRERLDSRFGRVIGCEGEKRKEAAETTLGIGRKDHGRWVELDEPVRALVLLCSLSDG